MAKGLRHLAGMYDDVAALYPSRGPRSILTRLRSMLTLPAAPETPVDLAERRASKRSAAKAEMARLEAIADSELPKLAAAEAKARAHLERLTPAYQEAMRALDVARMAHSRRAHELASERQRQSLRVVENAEPIIDEFLSGMSEALRATIGTQVHTEERNSFYDFHQQRHVGEVWSNVPSIDARRIAIVAVLHDAETFRADPDQGDLRERFAAIIEGLPDPEIVVKVYDSADEPPPQRELTRDEEYFKRHGEMPEAPEERRRRLARAGIRNVD